MTSPEERSLLGDRGGGQHITTKQQSNQQSFAYLTFTKLLAVVCLVGTLYLSYSMIRKSTAERSGTMEDLSAGTVFSIMKQSEREGQTGAMADTDINRVSDEIFTLLRRGVFLVTDDKEEEFIRHNYGYLKPIPNFTPYNREQMRQLHRNVKDLVDDPLKVCLHRLSKIPRTVNTTSYSFFLERGVLKLRNDTSHITLPPVHQVYPRFFFPKNALHHNNSNLDEMGERNSSKLNLDMQWFREAIGVSEHHSQWHLTFAYTETIRSLRQGEKFVYMHEQLLARYDAELLALGYDRVKEWGPGAGLRDELVDQYNPRLEGFSARPANTILQDANTIRLIRIADVEVASARLYESTRDFKVYLSNGDKIPLDSNLIGLMVEAHDHGPNVEYYGNIHNDGHYLVASVNDPSGEMGLPLGPMAIPSTAAKDPIFYKWHKFIDNIFERFRRKLAPLRREELMIPGIVVEDINTYITDKRGIETSDTVNQMYTFFERKLYVTFYDPDDDSPDESQYHYTYKGIPHNIKPIHLYTSEINHTPFIYNVTITNNNAEESLLVLRVFLAPKRENLEESRKLMIQMDKFVARVPPGVSHVTRHSYDSSIVEHRDLYIDDLNKGYSCRNGNCTCGWPLNMLLPRGQEENMEFNLFILATDWEKDRIRPILDTQSSYCGSTVVEDPDSKRFGFPFNKRMEFKTMSELINSIGNSFVRTVRIKYLPDHRPDSLLLQELHRRHGKLF